MSIPKQITTTGKVFIKYADDISKVSTGDILLLLSDDAISKRIGDYESVASSGFVKAKIFDGLIWQNIDICEFCPGKENKFAKNQKAIDSMNLCRDMISNQHATILHRTYRGHFSVEEYEQQPYNRRSNRGRGNRSSNK